VREEEKGENVSSKLQHHGNVSIEPFSNQHPKSFKEDKTHSRSDQINLRIHRQETLLQDILVKRLLEQVWEIFKRRL